MGIVKTKINHYRGNTLIFYSLGKHGIKRCLNLYFNLITVVLFIHFSSPAVCLSNLRLDFSGYVYEMPIYSGITKTELPYGFMLNNPDNIMNLTRLRLKPVIDLDDQSRIEIHYEADVLYSEELMFKQIEAGKTRRQALDLNWMIYNKGNFLVNHFIDRFYYRNSFDWGDLTVGRQRISWGTGRVWQPTDLFGPISPTNFSKFEKDGADALSLKYSLGLLSDIELVYNYTCYFPESNYGARFRTNFSEFDVSLLAGWFDQSARAGLDFAGNFFGAGIRGELLYTAKKDTMNGYAQAIFGADYQFTEDIYALLEFQFNGRGSTCKYCYDLMALSRGEVLNVGKFYGAAQVSYLITPLFTASLLGIVNIGDGSGLIAPSASYSFTDEFSLKMGGMAFFGGSLEEYSYYPSIFYLLGEFYF